MKYFFGFKCMFKNISTDDNIVFVLYLWERLRSMEIYIINLSISCLKCMRFWCIFFNTRKRTVSTHLEYFFSKLSLPASDIKYLKILFWEFENLGKYPWIYISIICFGRVRHRVRRFYDIDDSLSVQGSRIRRRGETREVSHTIEHISVQT